MDDPGNIIDEHITNCHNEIEYRNYLIDSIDHWSNSRFFGGKKVIRWFK